MEVNDLETLLIHVTFYLVFNVLINEKKYESNRDRRLKG